MFGMNFSPPMDSVLSPARDEDRGRVFFRRNDLPINLQFPDPIANKLTVRHVFAWHMARRNTSSQNKQIFTRQKIQWDRNRQQLQRNRFISISIYLDLPYMLKNLPKLVGFLGEFRHQILHTKGRSRYTDFFLLIHTQSPRPSYNVLWWNVPLHFTLIKKK